MPRIRRPLLALIVLVVALLIGYAVRAARSDGATPLYSVPIVTTGPLR